MSKIRMNARIREELMALVEKRVDLNDEAQKLSDLRFTLECAIRDSSEVPLADFEVLRKYGYGCETVDWYVMDSEKQHAVRPYILDKEKMMVRETYHYIRLDNTIRSKKDSGGWCVDDEAYGFARKYVEAQHKYLENLRVLHIQYRQLIKSYKYFEDLCEFWPEAKEITPPVTAFNSPVPVNAEYMKAVKADLNRRGVKVDANS